MKITNKELMLTSIAKEKVSGMIDNYSKWFEYPIGLGRVEVTKKFLSDYLKRFEPRSAFRRVGGNLVIKYQTRYFEGTNLENDDGN